MKKPLLVLNEAGFTAYVVVAAGVALFSMVGYAVWKTVADASPHRERLGYSTRIPESIHPKNLRARQLEIHINSMRSGGE